MKIPPTIADIRTKSRDLVAREPEIELLAEVEQSPKAEFVAVYGRRRIGKTFLIRECFKNRPFYFEFVGAEKSNTAQQIKNFVRELTRTFAIQSQPKIENWSDAFFWLTDLIESLSENERQKNSNSTKKVIFFDELPWLASRKSGFLEALSYFWNSFAQKRTDLVLVACGSAASWMIKHILENKGGLHNRVTRRIQLLPFNLKETQQYLLARGIRLGTEQIAEVYMATGGVAFYLDQMRSGESAAQFINDNFFVLGGVLRDEFDSLFRSLFEHHHTHVDIVRSLARHPFGLSSEEIAKKIKISSGGGLSGVLSELERSGFLQFSPKLGNKKRQGVYRLIDEYSLFYLTWVEPIGRTGSDPNYWQRQVGQSRYHTWLGQAFENLCFKHSEQIKLALGISGIFTHISGFRNKNVQIDMIIDRNDKAMNLCEMKYTAHQPFEMTAAEARKIQTRKTELLASLKRKKQIFVTLVTSLPAQRNQHYLGVIDIEVELKALFS